MAKINIDANIRCENDVWQVSIECPRWLMDELTRKSTQHLSVESAVWKHGLGADSIGIITLAFGAEKIASDPPKGEHDDERLA